MAFGLGKLTDFLNKGERFPEIAESKRALDAVGIVGQLPIGSLCLQALGFITREWRDAAATRRACFLGKDFAHILVSKTILAAKATGTSAYLSISPNTMSSEPMIAETSASMCPRLKKSIACRWANEGARILHLYGRLVPSAIR